MGVGSYSKVVINLKIFSKGYHWIQNGNVAYLSIGRTLFVGAKESVLITLPIQVSLEGIQGLVSCLQRKGLMSSVYLTRNGLIRVQMYNTTEDVITLSPRLMVCALMLQPNCHFHAYLEEEGTPKCQVLEVKPNLENLQLECMRQFPLLFGVVIDEEERKRRKQGLEVKASEIEWCAKVPLSNSGLTYNLGLIDPNKIQNLLSELESKNQIRRMLPNEQGRFSPIMFKEKSDGRLRPLNDLRAINKFSKAWLTYFPGAIHTMRQIPSEWSFFSLIDLWNGFHQIPIDQTLQKRFAFEALGHRFCWCSLPQGWSSSSGLFHSRIASILEDLPVVNYIDDLVVGGSTVEEHRKNLFQVLERLEKWGLLVNPQKMKLERKSIEFLGFTLENGTFSFHNYLEKISNQLPKISGKRSIRKIIGMASFTRPACPGLAGYLAPLQQLLKSPSLPPAHELENMVNQMWKQVLNNNLEVYRNFNSSFIPQFHLYCDWSGNEGQGYALFFGSKESGILLSLNSQQISNTYKRSSYLGELATICWALRSVEPIIKGSKVTVYTDNEASMKRLSNPPKPADFIDRRISKYLGYMMENFPLHARLGIRYIPREQNCLADALSKWKMKHQKSDYTSINVTSISSQQLQWLHDAHSGHFNALTTWRHLKRAGHYWKNMWKDTMDFVKSCHQCQMGGRRRYHSLFYPRNIDKINHLVLMDFAGPYSLPFGKGSRHVLLLVDSLSRFLKIKLARKADHKVVKQTLQEWMTSYGRITQVQSDNAPAFVAFELNSWLLKENVSHLYSPPYKASSNGLVERMVGHLKMRLKKALIGYSRSWTSLIEEVESQINGAVSSTTLFSPNELFLGLTRDGQEATETELENWRNQAKLNTNRAQKRINDQLQRKYKLHPPLNIGDHVLLWKNAGMRTGKPFEADWSGPFRITDRVSRQLWTLTDNNGRKIRNVHTHDLKKYNVLSQ